MDGRLMNALEGIAFALAFGAVAWIAAFIVKKTSGRDIGTATYYSVAIIAGFATRLALIAVLSRG